MARYNRINLDGESVTRTALTGAALKAGNLVKLNASGAFVVHATAGKKQDFVYLMNVDYLQGKKADDTITSGDTGVGEMFVTNRECAALVVAATVLKLDSPLTSDGAGLLKLAVLGTDEVIAYSCEALTVAAGGELVRVRAA
jgi:hypothetical protein